MRASGLCLRLRCGALAGGGLLLSLVGAGLLGQDNSNVEARWPVELKLQHDCLIAWCWFCHAGGRGNARLCAPSRHLLGQKNYNVETRWPVELPFLRHVFAGFFSGEGGRGNARLCARGLPSRHLLGDRDYNVETRWPVELPSVCHVFLLGFFLMRVGGAAQGFPTIPKPCHPWILVGCFRLCSIAGPHP